MESNIGFAGGANKTLLGGMPRYVCTTLLKFLTKESRCAEASYRSFTTGDMLVWWPQSWVARIGSKVIVCDFAFPQKENSCFLKRLIGYTIALLP